MAESNRSSTKSEGILIAVAGVMIGLVAVGGWLLVSQFRQARSEAQMAMEAFCSTVEVGMMVDEVKALAEQRSDIEVGDFGDSLQIDYRQDEFLCVCGAEVEATKITSVAAVWCTD